MSESPHTGTLVPIAVNTVFSIGEVWVFLWKGDPLTLIDAGINTPDAREAMLEGLRREDVAPRDIRRIIVTHHHPDHVGLLRFLADASGAEICGHPEVVQQHRLGYTYDEAQREFFTGLMRELGVPAEVLDQVMLNWGSLKSLVEFFEVTRPLPDESSVGPFTVYHVPGHSATDILLVNSGEGYTISGDHLLEKVNPNPMLRRPAPGQVRGRSMVEFRQSLMRSRGLELGRCFPSHGKPFDDHRRVVDALLAQHERRNERILARIAHDGFSPYDASKALYPRQRTPDTFLCLSAATGQLELLESRGVLRSEIREGVVRYSRQGEG